MRERYKIFSEQYNSLLDLIEIVDEDLAKKYEKVIDGLPNVVINKLEEKSNSRVMANVFEL